MVVSIDPRRVYVGNPNAVEFKAVRVRNPGKGFYLKAFREREKLKISDY